jgi:hypothetical protein
MRRRRCVRASARPCSCASSRARPPEGIQRGRAAVVAWLHVRHAPNQRFERRAFVAHARELRERRRVLERVHEFDLAMLAHADARLRRLDAAAADAHPGLDGSLMASACQPDVRGRRARRAPARCRRREQDLPHPRGLGHEVRQGVAREHR